MASPGTVRRLAAVCSRAIGVGSQVGCSAYNRAFHISTTSLRPADPQSLLNGVLTLGPRSAAARGSRQWLTTWGAARVRSERNFAAFAAAVDTRSRGGSSSNGSLSTSASAALAPSPPLCRSLHASAASCAPVEVVVPPMGDSITEGAVAAVLKQPGDAIAEDDIIAQIETDKVTIDVRHTAGAGVLAEVLVAEGDTVTVGQLVARVEPGAAPSGGAASARPPAAEAAPAAAPAAAEPKAEAASAPAPAKKPAAAAAPAAAPKPSAPAPAAVSTSDASERPERRVKMTRLRLRVAERLKGAQNTYAMLSTFNEVDMTGLMEMRAAYKDVFAERHGVKLGFMSAFVKAAAAALKEVPAVNGVIDGTDIIYRDYTDISIAVATPKGLVVPVLRGADHLSFADVEKRINELGRKARDGSISIDDMAGGTFTISNGGVYGSMLSTPIINPPQSAILGMHNITQRPVVLPGGTIAPRPMMYIALTYDHRLIDGREAVTFLKRIKEGVEDPRRLLLDV